MNKSLLLSFLFLMFLPFSVSSADTNNQVQTITTQNVSGKIILITMSRACHCTLLKCDTMRERVRDVLTNSRFARVPIEEVDYSTQQATAEKYFQQYQLSFMPVLIAVDRSGKECFKCSTDLVIDELIKALDKILEDEKSLEAEQGDKL